MPNPQQPELRRSETNNVVDDAPGENAAGDLPGGGAKAHGTDKGSKGGGRGGGVPPEQQSPYPS